MPNNIRNYLIDRGQDPSLFKYGPAYGADWIAIPIPDEAGKPLFYKLRKNPFDTESEQPKYKFWPAGKDGAEIFGRDVLPAYTDYVVICEGEMDCLLLRNQGINAITSTAGAGTFKDKWISFFFHIPNIYICFDRDKAGEQGAEKLMLKLIAYNFNVFMITLPEMEGKDISDWFIHNDGSKEDFFSLAIPVGIKSLSLPPAVLSDDIKAIRGEIARLVELEDKYKKAPLHPVINDYVLSTIARQIKAAQRKIFSLRNVDNPGVDVEKVKETPLLGVLETYGIRHTNIGQDKIRFKIRDDDDTPSATGYLGNNSYYDYGSSQGGSVIDLVMVLEKCDFKKALNILYEKNL